GRGPGAGGTKPRLLAPGTWHPAHDDGRLRRSSGRVVRHGQRDRRTRPIAALDASLLQPRLEAGDPGIAGALEEVGDQRLEPVVDSPQLGDRLVVEVDAQIAAGPWLLAIGQDR